MEKSVLNKIQKVAKVGKIISVIALVFSVLGFGLSLAGIGSLFVSQGNVSIGSKILGNIISTEKISYQEAYITTTIAVVTCACDFIIAKKTKEYFSDELKAGTPFTSILAVQLKKLGKTIVIVSIISVVLSSFVQPLYALIMNDQTILNIEIELSTNGILGLGLIFIVLSWFVEYTVAIEKKLEKQQSQEVEEQTVVNE